jgi:hypothetical protein
MPAVMWNNFEENDRVGCDAARQHAANHRQEILASETCGCFFCLAIYRPSEISEWADEDENGVGQTALCPRCGIDSVIGSKSGVSITGEFLSRISQAWF